MNMDWNNGTWRMEPLIGNECRVTVCSNWAPIRAYQQLPGEDPLAVYGDLLPVLRKADLSVVNIECVLGTHGEPIPKGGPNLRGDERSVCSLTQVPFHVACLANNHTLDYGVEGLAYTLDVLQRAGMQTVGGGLTGDQVQQPLIVTIQSIRIGIINCAEGEACRSVDNGPGANGLTFPRIEQQIQSLKKETDVVIVIFHGGVMQPPLPPPYVVEALRRLAEAGASAVVGHHPPVPQGIEMHRGVPIIYSQGQFVFWQENNSLYRHIGYLVHLNIYKGGIRSLELTPYLIERGGLSLLKGKMKTDFLQSLQTVSNLVKDPQSVREVWNAFTDAFGIQGIIGGLEKNISSLKKDRVQGAAKLHNLFFTQAHRDLYTNGLKRAFTEELGNSPEWARELVHYWMHCSIDDGVGNIPCASSSDKNE